MNLQIQFAWWFGEKVLNFYKYIICLIAQSPLRLPNIIYAVQRCTHTLCSKPVSVPKGTSTTVYLTISKSYAGLHLSQAPAGDGEYYYLFYPEERTEISRGASFFLTHAGSVCISAQTDQCVSMCCRIHKSCLFLLLNLEKSLSAALLGLY